MGYQRIARRLDKSPSFIVRHVSDNHYVEVSCEIAFRGGIKKSYRARIAIVILKTYWSLSIGSAMFEGLITTAKERGTEIMELEFIEGKEQEILAMMKEIRENRRLPLCSITKGTVQPLNRNCTVFRT